jgi:hypothetical protein
MNPFSEHAANMEDYEKTLDEPVNNQVGDWIVYGGSRFKAVVSHFVQRQVLVAGGFSPRLTAQAIVQKKNVPSTLVFKTGQSITAYQVGGSIHRCQIESAEDTFLEWRINLWDLGQGA